MNMQPVTPFLLSLLRQRWVVLLLASLCLGPAGVAAQQESARSAAGQTRIMTASLERITSALDDLIEVEKNLEELGEAFLTNAQFGLTLNGKISETLDGLQRHLRHTPETRQRFAVLVERVGTFGRDLSRTPETADEHEQPEEAEQRSLQDITVAIEQVNRVLTPDEQRRAHAERSAAVETEFRALQHHLDRQLANARETSRTGAQFAEAVTQLAEADDTIRSSLATVRRGLRNVEIANRRARSAILVPDEVTKMADEAERLAAQGAIVALRGVSTVERTLRLFNRRNRQIRSTLADIEEQIQAIRIRHPGWINTRRINILVALLVLCFAILYFIVQAQRGTKLFIRRIAGLSALDDAVGRATEMGRPIVFVTGIREVDDVQTLAGMSILSTVASKAAEYDTNLFVPCCMPLAYSMAQEVVKESYLRAGRPDAYNQDHIRFLTSDQFGFVAGVDGIMIREKAAACFYLGRFYAESLILAETGNGIGAIQIAGTAEVAQLPFFVAACDYTLIGEELFAASAYLSGEPRLLGSLKGQDVGKAIMIGAIIVGSAIQILISYETLPESLSLARFFAAS